LNTCSVAIARSRPRHVNRVIRYAKPACRSTSAATNSLRRLFYAQSANTAAVAYSGPSGVMTTETYAASQRVDQLNGVTINGVSGLTDPDIPDDITEFGSSLSTSSQAASSVKYNIVAWIV
jgi:hypothetical protein